MKPKSENKPVCGPDSSSFDPSDLFPPEDRLMSERSLADYLNVSVKFLQKLRMEGGGPKYIHLSKRLVRYRRGDVTSWIENNARWCTSEGDARES